MRRKNRRVSVALVALLTVLLQACGSGGSSNNGTGASDSSQSAVATKAPDGSSDVTPATPVPAAVPTPPSPPAFVSVQTLAVRGEVVHERVQYMSGTLRINGLVCRPNNNDDVYPILMYQHAGFGGLRADWDGDGLCNHFAARGYAVFMSSFRGEDGSDGQVETCLGEVDDSIRLLEIARTQRYVKPQRAALLGVSHGGCISLQMLARGVDVQVVVDLAGPTEWSSLYDIAAYRTTLGDASSYQAEFLANANATLGSPTTNPAAYIARSPYYAIDNMKDWPGALLVVHGGKDEVVPPFQSCAFVRNMGGFVNSHLNWRYIPRWYEKTTTQHPSECGHPEMHWESGAHPGKNNWQAQRHFVFYDRMAHSDGFQLIWALDDAEDFIRTKFPGH